MRLPHRKKKVASLARLEFLARPKQRYKNFIPDKPSPYWSDYLQDPTPHYILDPFELYQYYVKSTENFKRLESLTKSKLDINQNEPETRPLTSYGVSRAALKYVPTERIIALAEPKMPIVVTDPSVETLLPPLASRSSSKSIRSGRTRSLVSVKSKTSSCQSGDEEFIDWYKVPSNYMDDNDEINLKKSSKDISTFHGSAKVRRSRPKKRVMWDEDTLLWERPRSAKLNNNKCRHNSKMKQKGKKSFTKLPPLNDTFISTSGPYVKKEDSVPLLTVKSRYGRRK